MVGARKYLENMGESLALEGLEKLSDKTNNNIAPERNDVYDAVDTVTRNRIRVIGHEIHEHDKIAVRAYNE